MSNVWSVKTGRASLRHRRDARVHGHKTMAMHDMGTPPATIAVGVGGVWVLGVLRVDR